MVIHGFAVLSIIEVVELAFGSPLVELPSSLCFFWRNWLAIVARERVP